jgi:hypothetical protein
MRSNGESSACLSDPVNEFSERFAMTDNRKFICLAGARCNRLLRFAGHRLEIAGRAGAGSKISGAGEKTRPTGKRQTTFATARLRDTIPVRNSRLTRNYSGRALAVHSALANLDARLSYLWPQP